MPGCQLCSSGGRFKGRSLEKHKRHCHYPIYKCEFCSAELPDQPMRLHLDVSHGITQIDSGYFKQLRKPTSKKKKKKYKDKKEAIPYHPSTQRSDGGLASKLKILQGKGQHEENPSSDSELGQSESSEVEHQTPLDLQRSNGNLEPARNTQENTSQIFHCDLCPENFSSQEILMMHTKFAHCWKCGYCPNLAPFSGVSDESTARGSTVFK